VREDQQPAGMVKQDEKTQATANGASGNGVAEAVDVDVLIRAPVLVLNLNYVPVNVCTVRRAIVLVTKGKAELLEHHLGELHTVSRAVEAPSVIRLEYMVKRPFLPRKLSKKEVFLRDKFTQEGPRPDVGPRDSPAATWRSHLGKRGDGLQQM